MAYTHLFTHTRTYTFTFLYLIYHSSGALLACLRMRHPLQNKLKLQQVRRLSHLCGGTQDEKLAHSHLSGGTQDEKLAQCLLKTNKK